MSLWPDLDQTPIPLTPPRLGYRDREEIILSPGPGAGGGLLVAGGLLAIWWAEVIKA